VTDGKIEDGGYGIYGGCGEGCFFLQEGVADVEGYHEANGVDRS